MINRGLGGACPTVDADVLEAVTEALLREYQCKLTYQARSWPEPEEIVVHPFGLIFRDPNVYLKLRCDKPVLNHLIESPLGFDQITQEIDDKTFEIAVTVGDTQDLRWWLTAQAVYCDILEPAWLREEIEATLKQGLKRTRQTKAQ